jgi:hypothetical protein
MSISLQSSQGICEANPLTPLQERSLNHTVVGDRSAEFENLRSASLDLAKKRKWEPLSKCRSVNELPPAEKKARNSKNSKEETQSHPKVRERADAIGASRILLKPRAESGSPFLFENASATKEKQKTSQEFIAESSSLFVGQVTEELLISACEAHRISKEQFKQIIQYIELHASTWEQSNSNAIFSHRLYSGLPRSVFWVRGEGAFIKLAGGEQERRMLETCRRTGLSPLQYRMAKIKINQQCYLMNLYSSTPRIVRKEISQLATDVVYCPTQGLFMRSIRSEDLEASPDKPVWVGIEQCRDEAEINRGGFKKVVKSLHIPSGEIVAFGSSGRFYPGKKSVVSGKDGIRDSEQCAFEVLSHPNIQSAKVIEYDGVKVDPATNQYIVKRALISSWFPKGDVVSNLSQLNVDEKVQLSIDLLEALAYMHQPDNKKDGSGPWVHLDVKPDNMFLDSKDGRTRAVLGDFGFAGPITERRSFYGGTLEYASPETCSKKKYGEIGTHTDIWLAGVTLYTIFTEKFPVWHPINSITELLSKFEDSTTFETKLKQDLENIPIGRLLQGMLRIRSDERLTVWDCLDYFTTNKESQE